MEYAVDNGYVNIRVIGAGGRVMATLVYILEAEFVIK